ncbi:MAG: hypothetical protein IJ092_03660 [Atopobiaceae bacterium]|nr:hypothetical protein [Atopobiaceae bacterium]
MPKRIKTTLLSAIVTFSMVLSLVCPVSAVADEAMPEELPNEEALVVEDLDPVASEEVEPSEEPLPTDQTADESDASQTEEPEVQEEQLPEQDGEAVTGEDEAELQVSDAEATLEEQSEEKADDKKEDQANKPQVSSVSYKAHVQNVGWQKAVKDGKTAGTSGKSLRVEGMTFELLDAKGKRVDGIRYRSHVQNIGWQDWVKDGAQTGTTGRSLRVEAVKLELYGEAAEQYDIYYRAHVQNYGWLSWAKNGESAGSSGRSLRVEAIQVVLRKKGDAAPSANGSVRSEAFIDGTTAIISTHCQNVGWQEGKRFGDTAGTTGRGLRMEAFKATLSGNEVSGGIAYQAHVQNIGWQGEVSNGKVAGTTGRSLRVEAVKFRLTGEMAQLYDVYYRAHVENYGWLGWTKNGGIAGTTGMSRRIEAMQVKVVRKGDPSAPSTGGVSHLGSIDVVYSVDVEGQDWQARKTNGATAGNGGGSLAIEQLKANVIIPEDAGLSGGLTYSASVSGTGWQRAAADGVSVGSDMTPKGRTTTKDKGIEAVRFELTGALATYYDVYYRTYVDGFGWLSWARNGSNAGTADYSSPIRGIQVKVLPKGASQGDTSTPYVDKGSKNVGQLLSDANARQKKVVSAAGRVPSPGSGLCAHWISQVGEAGGVGRYYGMNACDQYYAYCKSSNRSDLKVGMIVAVSTHNRTYAGSLYGHVAVYVGDGWVMDNVGYIRKMRLNEWINYYGQVVPVKWGWLGNVKLG